jgi:hypothetical protein
MLKRFSICCSFVVDRGQPVVALQLHFGHLLDHALTSLHFFRLAIYQWKATPTAGPLSAKRSLCEEKR